MNCRFLDRVLDRCTHALAVLAGVTVAFVALMICVSVALRVVGQGGIGAAEEYAGALTMVAVFAGVAHTYRAGGHVRTTVIADRLPGPARRSLAVIAAAIAVAFAGVFLVALAGNWWDLLQSGARSPSRQFAQWVPMSAVVLGSSLLVLEALSALVRTARAAWSGNDKVDSAANLMAAGLDVATEERDPPQSAGRIGKSPSTAQGPEAEH